MILDFNRSAKQAKGTKLFIKNIRTSINAALMLAFIGSQSLLSPALGQSAETIEIPRTIGGQTVTLKPTVHWPSGTGPFGAVLVVNSSAGKDDPFLKATHPVMNERGIATIYLDTFTPRGIKNTIRDHSQVSSTAMILDALQILEVVRKNPKIKADKVAIQGQSKGGIAALHAATQQWHLWFGQSFRPFDASIAFAPTCELQFKEPELVSPLMSFLGEKDDTTLAAPCVALFDRMKTAGQKVQYEVVPGAIHSWSTYGYSRSQTGFTARKCAKNPLYYTKDAFIDSRTGSKVALSDVYKICGEEGYFYGGPADKRSYILSKSADWLKSMGW